MKHTFFKITSSHVPRTLATALLFMFYISGHAQEIAITFDDAPTGYGPLFSGKERTERIINALKKNGVDQVAFFVIAGNVNATNELRLQQYAKEGHLIANHTQSHQWIHQLGTIRYCDDIKKADSMLRKLNGFVPWFRYPFLDEGKTKSARDSIRQTLMSLGLSNGYVTVDNYDWYLNGLLKTAVRDQKKINYDELKNVYLEHIWGSIQFYDKIAKQVLNRSPKHVLLLHENDLAAKYLPDLITLLKEKGWKIISPKVAYADPIAKEVPDVLFNGQGRIAAIARSQNVAARDLVQDSEDEAFLDDLVKKRNIFE